MNNDFCNTAYNYSGKRRVFPCTRYNDERENIIILQVKIYIDGNDLSSFIN